MGSVHQAVLVQGPQTGLGWHGLRSLAGWSLAGWKLPAVLSLQVRLRLTGEQTEALIETAVQTVMGAKTGQDE